MLTLDRYVKKDHNCYCLITVKSCLSLDKFVNDVLPSHIDVSISKTVAAGKYKLSEEEITYVNIIIMFSKYTSFQHVHVHVSHTLYIYFRRFTLYWFHCFSLLHVDNYIHCTCT